MNYGLIGKTLSHSFSKKYFSNKFKENNIEDTYENYECRDVDALKTTLSQLKLTHHGLNVTLPYKESIIELLDYTTKEAESIGAVNCILIKDGKCIGHNTDYLGFYDSIKNSISKETKRALILGTGGAAKAVSYALINLAHIEVDFVSSSHKDNTLKYAELNYEILNRYSLIINTTPLGMYPTIDLFPDIPYQFITEKHICIDLIYNPLESLFLAKSKNNGALTINGYQMLINQAELSYKIWKNTLNL